MSLYSSSSSTGGIIYTSPAPSVPVVSTSVFTHILSLDARTGDVGGFPGAKPAFIDADTGTTVTRVQLRQLALEFAFGMRTRAGARRDDVVMIYSPNALAWPVVLFGSVAAGLRCTLANSAYLPRELVHQYTDSGAGLVVTHEAGLAAIREMFAMLGVSKAEGDRRTILLTRDLTWAGGPSASVSEDAAALVKMGDLLGLGSLIEEEKFDGEKLATETVFLCYSSGTTGKPKGVETTHQNVTVFADLLRSQLPPLSVGKEAVLGILPLYHIYGLMQILHIPFTLGWTTILQGAFDPVNFCRIIQQYAISFAYVVPPMLVVLARHPAVDKFDLSSLEYMVSAAAPLGADLVRLVKQRLLSKRAAGGTLWISQGYGLTETTTATHLVPFDARSDAKAGSIGPLLPNLEARIISENGGGDAQPGERGELWIRGKTIMKGYLNNVKATAETTAPDDWFMTGDIAYRDEDGFYYIVDRKKELIKYKGFQGLCPSWAFGLEAYPKLRPVPPAELESVLLTHPDIADVAVIGIEDLKEATELPRAYVVHASPDSLQSDAEKVEYAQNIVKWMQTKVAKHKFLRGGVRVIDIIPKSAAAPGKPDVFRDITQKPPPYNGWGSLCPRSGIPPPPPSVTARSRVESMAPPRIYESGYSPVPIVNTSIYTHLLGSRTASGDDVGATTLTRGGLKDLTLRLAYGLKHVCGAKRGDTLLIFSPNSLAWPVVLYGGVAAGLRCTLANSGYTHHELEHQYKDSRAKIVVCSEETVPVAREMFSLLGLSEAEADTRIVVMPQQDLSWAGGPQAPKPANLKNLVWMQDLLAKGKLAKEEKFDGLGDETVYLCYSSGTTGKPKGVETTHQNMTSVVDMTKGFFPLPPDGQTPMIAILPFYHIFGASNILNGSLSCATPVVVMQRFDPELFCANIERYRVMYSFVVPPVLVTLVRHEAVDRYDLSSLEYMLSGAAPLGGELVSMVGSKNCPVCMITEIRQVRKRLLGKRKAGSILWITQGYGLTETSPSTHTLEYQDSLRKIGSCGTLLPNLQARLVEDEDGLVDAEEGQPGELWLRGKTIMKGYLNNVASTKHSITPDKWFKTGDVAVRDNEGFFYIVDRRKELIKYKGFQVPPAELEAILLSHPGVADAAVIGVDDPVEATELPRAYVVPADPAKVSSKAEKAAFEAAVAQWIQTKVAKHKYLRGGVAVIDLIPKSPAGKILRRQLRELAKEEVKRGEIKFATKAKL
ncbi:unnamed protein product [Mycena citricolor]|uniref:4-coumarate-CoA ligase n=1 Tax=Mycena citricolor TaxID=2018698 RepID=A0AAD2GTP2_9AGAR|nr:unnamed protein product [Mycena citricolor]